MLLDFEIGKDGRPICFLIWEVRLGGSLQLVCICNSRVIAERRVTDMNKRSREQEDSKRYHMEEAELNHLFGSSMIAEHQEIERMYEQSHENLQISHERIERSKQWESLAIACDPFSTWKDLIDLSRDKQERM
jgi:hypothetical protein